MCEYEYYCPHTFHVSGFMKHTLRVIVNENSENSQEFLVSQEFQNLKCQTLANAKIHYFNHHFFRYEISFA